MYTAALQERPAEEHHKPGGISSSLLGMVLFIASEVMFFGGLFGAYFTIRSAAAPRPPPDTPHLSAPYAAILTAILVTSSVTMQLGVWAIRKNEQRGRSCGWPSASSWARPSWPCRRWSTPT